MREMKSILYYLIVNVRFTFIVFWCILSSIYVVSVLLSVITDSEGLFFQPYIPIYIFCMVVGMWTVKNAIPYLLKMGITRKMMYGTIWIYFLLFAIVNVILTHIFPLISKLLNKKQTGGTFTLSDGDAEVVFDFTHVAQFMSDDVMMNRILVDVIICFTALTFMFIVGLVFYQYGLIGGFSFIGLLFILYFISIATNQFVDMILYIYNHYSMTLYYKLILISFAIYALSYIILRRLTLK